jgi:molybdate transport repressor ModE-like protein
LTLTTHRLADKRAFLIFMAMNFDQWRGLEFRHLAALDAVANEGSFRRAAAALGYSHAAISQQIATLERLLGARLVERGRGRSDARLTPAGHVALGHARAITSRLTAARADVAAAETNNLLRIGLFQTIGSRLLPTIIVRLRERETPVAVDVLERPTDAELLHGVTAGELDLSFITLPVPHLDPALLAVEIAREPYVLLVARHSPLAEAQQVQLKELRDQPLIVASACRAGNAATAAVGQTLGELRIVFRSDDNPTIHALVAGGVGAALVPRLLVDDDDKRVAIVELHGAVPTRSIAVTWDRERTIAPLAREVAEIAAGICQEILSCDSSR